MLLLLQVGHSCVEHGRALQLLRERYSELANALYLAVRNLAQHAAAASDTASHAAAAATAAEAGAAVLDQRLAEQQQADSHLRDELEACRGRLEQAEQDAASDMQVLQQQVLVLRQQLLQVREQLECCQLEAQRATDRARDDAETQAQAAEAAQQALQQRLGFLSAQLAALRYSYGCNWSACCRHILPLSLVYAASWLLCSVRPNNTQAAAAAGARHS